MPSLNPWFYLGALLLVLGLCSASAYEGHKVGVNSQKVADQKQFDDINNELAAQKAAANAKYRDATEALIAAIDQRDKIKHQLENQYVQNQATTNKLHDSLAAYSLRFQSEDSGHRDNCGQANGSQGNTPCIAGASTRTVQLPSVVAENLRRLALEADRLNDAYKACYAWANR